MMRFPFVAATSLVLFLLVPAPTTGQGVPDSLAFPALPEWSLEPDPVTYDAGTLWEYINGAADMYVSYGFDHLQCATYRSPDGIEVRAEMYRHADAAHAFGMYAQERSPESPAVGAGCEGYGDDGMLNFAAGRWYVKLAGGRGARGGHLAAVAGAIDVALGAPRNLPEGFALLPGQGRIPRSGQFIAREFLGFGFLRNVYRARYEDAGEVSIFVMQAGSPAEAQAARDGLLQSATGRADGPMPGSVCIIHPHHGSIGLLIRGSLLFGVMADERNVDTYALLKKLQ